jgi:hypothetical protein
MNFCFLHLNYENKVLTVIVINEQSTLRVSQLSLSISMCMSRYEAKPLIQTQWDRCDQQNHQTDNYVVNAHHLYCRT